MKIIKLPNGTETSFCLACGRDWSMVTHSSKGLCRGCARKAQYAPSKLVLAQPTTTNANIIDSLPREIQKLIDHNETYKSLGCQVSTLSYGSPKAITHLCPTCNVLKQTPFKLFVQGKNIRHPACCKEVTKQTNLSRYGVSNPLNTIIRIDKLVAIKNREIEKAFTDERYRIVKIERAGTEILIHFVCPEDHEHFINWKAWNTHGQRCFYCHGNYVDPREIEESFKNEKYTLLTSLTTYVNNLTPLEYQCTKAEHPVHRTAWKYWQRGVRCPHCVGTTSKGERELFESLVDFSPIKTREIAPPKELDIYIASKKVAIEYCGLYWHSECHERMYPKYHYDKMAICKSKGIRLITVFEDEWLQKKEVCLSRIKNALGVIKNRILARKCTIEDLNKEEARDFLNTYHLQGASGCEKAFGLFYQGVLVSAMTLGVPARYHTSEEGTILEMKRFASIPDTIIVGGAGRLFKKAISYAKEEGYKKIKSYCDRRWGTGVVYSKLGMVLVGQTDYTPHYTDGVKRYRNQTLASDESITEQEKAKAKKLYRIYDCGHQTWVYGL